MTYGLDEVFLGITKPDGDECRNRVQPHVEKSYFWLGVYVVRPPRYPPYLLYENEYGNYIKKHKSPEGRPDGDIMWDSRNKSNHYYQYYVKSYSLFFYLNLLLFQLLIFAVLISLPISRTRSSLTVLSSTSSSTLITSS